MINPLIINLAPNGVMPSKQLTPHVPITVHEIASDVGQCLRLGAQMVHVHARDANGQHSSDPALYKDIVQGIRGQEGGRDAVICVTTSGRQGADAKSRAAVLDLDGDARPDMASLTLSSLNFAQSASANAPETIRYLAACMQERGIKPELEVFDIGMAHFIHVLLKEGLVQPPLYVNVLLGNMFSAQPNAIQIGAVLSALPADCIVSLAGIGRFQMDANALGLVLTDGVRVGLEDNIWLDRKRTHLATNAQLVQRVIAQAHLMERPLMSVAEVRQKLGLARSDQ